jgi:ribonuclease E
VLRDFFNPEVVRVVVDAAAALPRVKAFLGSDQENVLAQVHDESSEILEHYRVNAAIRDALKPRVDLPSGGYVIIEPTEALTVIDVNSGSFTRSANARETVLWTNCEAATEIARQLRLRNIGGVVVVDFIDMESRRDQLQLLEHFTQAVRHDSARPQVAQITELGLVELTRKRQGQNLYELFGRACPSCGGLGHVAVLPGRDTLQPLATVPGLVRTAATPSRPEVPAATAPATDSGGTRRRRGGRGRGGDSLETYGSEPTEIAAIPSELAAAADSPAQENLGRRTEQEVVLVPMQPDQELVYGWMGLSPTLLLDPPPSGDDVVVRVVRPDADADAVLAEARQQLSLGGTRRRRRGRGGGEVRGNGAAESGSSPARPVTQALTTGFEPDLAVVDVLPVPVSAFSTASPMPINLEVPLSLTSHGRAPAQGLAEAPSPDSELVAAGGSTTISDAEAEPGDPRRRRRRSSAGV